METNIPSISNFTPHIIIENCPITKHNTLIVSIFIKFLDKCDRIRKHKWRIIFKNK